MREHLSMPLTEFFEKVYQETDYPAFHCGKRTGVMARQAVRRYIALMGNARMGDITSDTIARFVELYGRATATRYGRLIERLRHLAHYGTFPKCPNGSKPRTTLSESNGTLWNLYLTSYRPKKLRGGSKSTDKQYRVQLRHFALHLGHEPTLADLDEDVVSAFLAAHSPGRSPYTANKAYWCLMALWRHAAKKRLVDEFPTIPAMREPERIPRAWTTDELSRLMQACLREPGTIESVPAGKWWLALHLFCFTTGERISAALSLRSADVDLDRGEAMIPAEARKGKTRDMLYRLRPETVDAIRAIREPERELVFPWPLCIGSFYLHYKRLLKRAGLSTDRKSAPQKLRRSFASYVEAAGGNATAALAHSSRSIAVKSYLDPRICGGRNPSDLLPKIDLGGKDDAA